jgi:hypothetical protein
MTPDNHWLSVPEAACAIGISTNACRAISASTPRLTSYSRASAASFSLHSRSRIANREGTSSSLLE